MIDNTPSGAGNNTDEASETAQDMAILGEGVDDVHEEPERDEDEGLTPEIVTDEETDEEAEEEAEEVEVEEEDEEEEPRAVTPRGHRSTVVEVRAKYPDFFKDFPDFKHVMFRENEYASLFPTVDMAKETASKAEDFDHFKNLLNKGDKLSFVDFLKGIKEGDARDLQKMAENFLPALYEIDKDQYFKITSPIAQTIVRNAYNSAKRAGNKDLENAALHVAMFALGDTKYATGEKTLEVRSQDEQTPEQKTLDQERKDFLLQKYNETQQHVQMTSQQRLRQEIKKGLDPGKAFNEFTTNMLVKEILQEVGVALVKDKRHMNVMNTLWRKANEAGYIGNWKDRILATYLSGARAVMPEIRTRIRKRAQGEEEQKLVTKQERQKRGSDRRELSGQGTPGFKAQSGGVPKASEVDWSRTSDADFLAGNITLKKK